MNLQEIIKQQSDYVERSNISIGINRSLPTVSIEDNEGGAVFLQDHEADNFLSKCKQLSEQLPDTDFYIIEQAVAYQYLDCLA